ncbi:HAD family hydrolase [Candidatus Pacearchaeota archaeon]|nr:HAD family hydrolase [Candidatus Pacearchaeota archaeon]
MKNHKKPIIATTLSGLFIKSEPWKKAHILWYRNAAEKLKDESIMDWANREDYFLGVDEVMKKLHPQMSKENRVQKAREMFFDSVCEYIDKRPNLKNPQVIDYFRKLKENYKIALITTNTRKALDKILYSIHLVDFFDIKQTSKVNEKDNKKIVFERFIKRYGKPIVYVGGDRKDSYSFCEENKIPAIFANFEKEKEILGITSVHRLDELKIELGKFL